MIGMWDRRGAWCLAWVAAVALGGCPGDDGGYSAETSTAGSSTSAATDGSTGSATSTDSLSTTGTDGADTTGDDDGTTTGLPMPPTEGCDGVPLMGNPGDPAARGPWPVGVTTVDLDGLQVEVWYPAVPDPEPGGPGERYDIRDQLPPEEAMKISDEDNPWQPCDCTRGLEIDTEHGPYPAVFFIHGTASFRTQSVAQMVHWASRGFVVLAADHPGLRLGDLLGMLCGGPMVAQDIEGDVAKMIAAARGEAPGLEALSAQIDGTRIAVTGHSAGGSATASFGDEAQVLMPLAAGGVMDGSALASTLVMGAMMDSVVAYSSQTDGYDSSPAPKRLVGIGNQGHLAFSELCDLRNEAGEDLLTVAQNNGVCGANFASFLFQCSEDFLDAAETRAIVNFATAATLEETLQCSPIGDAFAQLVALHPDVLELRTDPPL